MFYIKILFAILIPNVLMLNNEDYCDKNGLDCNKPNIRYMFYDVNPPEGFNLRRDVFMRFAIFARKLSKSSDPKLHNFQLVLPPWSNLHHWKHTEEPEHLPWSLFFDLGSLQKFSPVIEMHQFFTNLERNYGYVRIEDVYVLQHYEDMFSSGKFEEKMNISSCVKEPTTNFYYYQNVTSNNIRCLSFHGHTSQLTKILKETNAQSIYFDHGEVALHDRFGDSIYWQCRRSMRFNKELVQISNDYRQRFLNSTDITDKTELPLDWRDEKQHRDAIGGPYLSVHLRRRDFVWGRPKQTPSIEYTAEQIREKLMELALDTVFIATDSPPNEFEELKSFLTPDINVFRFKPNKEVKKRYKDGGIAIIEQIICSHARYFIGTYESTFSFRIQEEREIMGFPEETTFNRLCGNDESESSCEKTTKWKIVY